MGSTGGGKKQRSPSYEPVSACSAAQLVSARSAVQL
eukprot:gene16946-biopygen8288